MWRDVKIKLQFENFGGEKILRWTEQTNKLISVTKKKTIIGNIWDNVPLAPNKRWTYGNDS